MSEINLRRLGFFRAVCETGSFTAAAERCGVSQPGLSSAIRQFEAELGVQLFERDTRHVSLTPTGEAIRPLVEAALTGISLAAHDIRAMIENRRLNVRIAAVPSLCSQLLPSIIQSFTQDHPDVHVTMHDLPNSEVARYVRDGEADLGVGLAPFEQDLFDQRPLFADNLVAVCGRGHPLHGRKSVAWAEIAREPIVTFKPTSHVYQVAEQAFASLGQPFKPVGTFNYRFSVLGMVAHNLAIAVLPSLSLDATIHSGLGGVPLTEPVVNRRYVLITRRQRPLLTPAQALIERMLERLQDHSGPEG